ncbi:serine hydrolase domain-containing protein [Rhizobium halophytocola]|uniref:CubicO group peptidase (Beta-lactamase class C family) n=1 Tax=Rhizobium halophytocola TaxID=735519 RepID=A0ABS4E527_9HYPH|nr:serine hydrolase domain-containing protein [Rhizobium halophytocola]MBP1853022.1 CubicO group peptidase (beta-lactamase class C family) [Rhizobium halophytocola]
MSSDLNWGAAQKLAEQFVAGWKPDEPGGAVLAFDVDGVRFAEVAGIESLSTGAPFSAGSVVRYASVTKHAFASLVLAHPDKIGLDDRLGEHLQELRSPLAEVTVGQALDMTGGLPDIRECLTLLGLSVFTETSAEPLYETIARMTRLNYEAGCEVSYSNTGYRLVERILENKGIFFRDHIRRQGAALGVVLDAPDVWNAPVAGLVPGYWHDGAGWQMSAAGLHISASGSMTGSATALAAWAQALMLGKGALAGVLDALSAPRRLADGRVTGYGLGIRRNLLGSRVLLGHGGSHPGYKSQFLIDPETRTGIVAVANREDANTYKIAFETMAGLLGEALPESKAGLPDGLYVTQAGPWWIEAKGTSLTYLDATDTLYDDGDGWVSSRSGSSPMRLRSDGAEIVGEIGHAPRRFLPAVDDGVPASLAGRWLSSEGAMIEIEDGKVVMGVGPVRHRMPLRSIGRGRYLFTLVDGPWTKTVCLDRLADDRFELVLSRARMIEYRRA